MIIYLKLREPYQRARLRREVRTLQETIAVQNRALGELTYAAHCGDLSGSNILSELMNTLDGLHAQLEARRRELDRLQGSLICPACDAVNNRRNIYCGGCGRPLGRSQG